MHTKKLLDWDCVPAFLQRNLMRLLFQGHKYRTPLWAMFVGYNVDIIDALDVVALEIPRPIFPLPGPSWSGPVRHAARGAQIHREGREDAALRCGLSEAVLRSNISKLATTAILRYLFSFLQLSSSV